MLKTRTIMIQMEWTEDKQFFLWATTAEDTPIPPAVWVKQLFLGHEESFYGSQLRDVYYNGKDGVLLSAWQWVTLFKSEQFNRFIRWEWDELGDFSLAAAPTVYDAVTDGSFLPEFKEEGLSFQVPEAVWEEFSSDFWDDSVVHMSNRELVASLFQTCAEQAFAEAGAVRTQVSRLAGGKLTPEELNRYFDAARWREWLGSEKSAAPFATGLRLTEPAEDNGEWTLETVLINQKNSEKVYPLNGKVLKSWMPFLAEAEAEQARWLRLFPWLEQEGSLRSKLPEEQAFIFLTEASEKLIQLGIPILLPSWWESIRNASLSLSAKVSSAGATRRPSFVGLQAILDFNWRLSMNGADLSEEEFAELAASNRRLVKVNGEWIQLDPEMVRKIQGLMKKAKKEGLRLQDLLEQELAPEEEPVDDWTDPRLFAHIQIELNRSFKKMIAQLKDVSSLPLVPAPANLHAELRPYQQFGMSWLLFLRSCGFGAVLADDMGLGKTIQLISYLQHVKKREQPKAAALIICPTSVLGNWQKELERFSPDLRVELHYGSSRKQGDDFQKSAREADVILTTYGLSHLDFETISSIEWSTVALDEAQNIKNAQTKQSRAIRKLKGGHHIALTGTPMENRLAELWAIFDFTNHGYLNSLQHFQKHYIVPIEKDGMKEKIEKLQAKIRPFLLRRTKKDPEVELNLPDKLEQKEYCPLTTEQAVLYEQLVNETMEEIGKLAAFERRGLILQMLNKIKQLCNHPALYLKEQEPAHIIERSEKMNKLMELVGNIIDREEACLIFTQYIGMGEMIRQEIEKRFAATVPFLNGSTSKEQRDRLVTQFQDGHFPVFLLSLKAGGTGLNLTAANHVIHFDRWWNPAVENQATDRAYRIGQNRFVHVHKMITTGTLEEKIDLMLEKKQALNDEIISSDQWITEMNDHELKELLQLGKA
ncbi:DEAD/DEAH box helicase [Bacillus aerolatus]|uniref:DEAD/DEAH box helicase n=1 Tax=Bacillus aerolatus TaxID=2653354 RepID=A0A6I1FGX2_9BACI|nr:DEAD/DEAH box helicase [Bacillus aerolatus]KAB7707445.1 DEAD/DEAH box helicase [Bacillus aerolatus]